MKKSTIAILGRPNVGKSTLCNRIISKTHSIVSPVEGVTRDRISDSFNWRGEDYHIIDTGGLFIILNILLIKKSTFNLI